MSRLARMLVVLHVHWPTFNVYYKGSPRLVRSLVRVTLNRVDAIVAPDDTQAAGLRVIAPDTHVVVVAEAAQLNALYRQVSP